MKIPLFAATAFAAQLSKQGVALPDCNALSPLPEPGGMNFLTANLGRGTFMSQICTPLQATIRTQPYCPAKPLSAASRGEPDLSFRHPVWVAENFMNEQMFLSPTVNHLAGVIIPGVDVEVAVPASSDVKIPEVAKAEQRFASNTEKWQKIGLDDLGELVPEVTIKHLADVVAQKINFKQGKGGAVAALAKTLGLTQRLALPAHLAMIIHLAVTDPNLLNIAKMGLMIAMNNPETNGIPPEGFEPLYELLEKWGYDRQGVLVDQKKYDARMSLMKTRKDDFAEFNKFLDDISFLSLLGKYFTEFPKSKEAAAVQVLENPFERTPPKRSEPPQRQ